MCDKAEEISRYRPFYPNRRYQGRRKDELLRGHGAAMYDDLLRACERGGDGRKTACSLFWTLGGNQVGKSAIIGWRDVIAPALRTRDVVLWPFDGELESLLSQGRTVVTETYPAHYYGWFSEKALGRKQDQSRRRTYGQSLLRWAVAHGCPRGRRFAETDRGWFRGQNGRRFRLGRRLIWHGRCRYRHQASL